MNIESILETLTIDEKIRLLNGDGDWHTYDCNGKIPSIMMTDGPHGLRKIEDEAIGDINGSKPATCFPTASAVASSFNPKLSYEMAKAIAKEAKAEDISIVLGCGINIKRSPLCGRNFEYYSEDPYVAGKMAIGYIKGMQSENVGTSLKHFAVNSQETRRMTSNSEVDERALREIYLSAFEEVIKEANPTTVMASYNRVNGDYSAYNKKLLIDILRDEWGYEGLVISDWGACIDAVKCFKNGLNLEMPDCRGYHTMLLKKAYEEGDITEKEIDNLAKKLLKLIYSFQNKEKEIEGIDFDAHNELAKKIENESAVLLKNEGTLPIDKSKKIIVIGELAENMRFQGGGSSHINSVKHKNAIDALIESGYEVISYKGYKNDTDKPDNDLIEECLKGVREHSKDNIVVLYFIGLTDSFEGEGYDRTTLEIPYNQVDLLERVASIVGSKKIAAVSFGGAPMDFCWDVNVSALLHMYLGGQAVGESVADLVSGKVNPSGKLAETIPNSITDTPAWRYFGLPFDDVEYRESIYVGYRYYETFNVPVKYPFGYGLSYTSFEYSSLYAPECFEGKDIEVRVTVKNVGNMAGYETVQLYILPEQSNFMRSIIELKGFNKVFLEPGEEKDICFVLNSRSFSVYDTEKGDFSCVSGVYDIAIGASVRDIRIRQNIVVEGSKYFRDEKQLFPDYFKSQPHGMEIDKKQFENLCGFKLSDLKNRKRGEFDKSTSFIDVANSSLFGRIVKRAVYIGIHFMFPGKKNDDPAMRMVKSGVDEGALEGLIATSGGVATPKLIDMLILNANKKYGQAFLRMFRK